MTNGKGVTDPAQLAIIASATQLLSAMIAGAVGANPNAAATAAQNETLNNACAPGHECGTFTSAVKDTVRATANAGLGIAEAVPNFFGGALPGFPDYVPFLDKYKLAYDDPDFGGLASFLLSIGIAKGTGAAVGKWINSGDGPTSVWDTSNTAQGSRYLNVSTNLTAKQFEQNLISNGYKVTSQGVGTNGPFTVMTNGTSTYTTYIRTSTGEAGAMFNGVGGVRAKFSLMNPQ
ncbi:hypothetical protein [Pandoraea anapnoica]|uniref:hypothetical protein n=1 Tax=Pandoraea anapnoica TaxID=2508301 RepID=UPI0012426E11|nr:hypothetical protein [Pandoraea anapnoica]